MNLEPTLSLRLLLPQNVHVPIIGTMTLTDFAIRVGLALLLGSLIGAEREWRHKLAGLKTNALVCVGSALFTCIGYQASSMGHADPTRIAGQIASGIGFLGAGAILRDGLTIRGLTTAATVWCAAAIGSLAGAGMLVHAVVGTGFIFGCNFALKEMAGMLFARRILRAQNALERMVQIVPQKIVRHCVPHIRFGQQIFLKGSILPCLR